MKCPKCGFEINDNSKFCTECGEAIPQEKECPKCQAVVPPTAKFCMECGYRFGASAPAAQNDGFSIGSKNVIAGDVIGKKVAVEKGATYIHNEDEANKLVKCHICNANIAVSRSITCPLCGEFVCENCYDRSLLLCSSCKKTLMQNMKVVGKTPGKGDSKAPLLKIMQKEFGFQLDGTVLKKYKHNAQIREFAIPSGVTEIGDYAFEACSHLKTVNLSGALGSVGKGAFSDCTSLESVNLNKNVKSIGDGAFLFDK